MNRSRTQIADRAASAAVDAMADELRRACRDREAVDESDIDDLLGMLRHDIENTVSRHLRGEPDG